MDALVQRFLVGFDREQIVGSELLDDQTRGLLIGVQRIEHHDFATEILPFIDFFQKARARP